MRVCPRCRSIFSMPVDRCGIDGGSIVETDVDPMVGTRLDRYDIIESLGMGAMGCVYRARHSVLTSEYAIKVLYGNLALNQRLIERFKREAQAIGQMKHPNIVEVTDFGQSEEGLTFLVMQLVEGQTLEQAVQRERPFSDHRIANIARQIASGLGEAHRRGFVHRDMKPANVMLTDANGLEVVKILDFGVVGMFQQAAMQRLTIAGHIVGTPNYMAPEQARSSSVGPAADLYALGVIMYEMAAGHPPFEGMGIAEVLLKQINEEPPPLPERTERGLSTLIRWLLEKKPEDRPPSAVRVIAEIERLNLDSASTEQILVSAVKRAQSSRAALPRPNNDSAETELHSKDDIQDAIVTPNAGVEVADVQGAEPTLLVSAPSSDDTDPPLPTMPIEISGSRPSPAIDVTQLDIRRGSSRAQRPLIERTKSNDELIHTSASETTSTPAIPDPSQTDRDLGDVLQADTLPSGTHHLPIPPEDPEVIETLPAPSSIRDTDIRRDPQAKKLAWVVIALAVGCGLLLAAILKKMYF